MACSGSGQKRDVLADPYQGDSVLARSESLAMLNLPLPEGAELVKRTEPDPENFRDGTERYAIKASSRDLVEFYSYHFYHMGWGKLPTSTSTSLMYRKGPAMIGVFIPDSGNTFRLMGNNGTH